MVKFICNENTDTLSITGSIVSMGSWQQDIIMIKKENSFEIDITIYPNTYLEYKYHGHLPLQFLLVYWMFELDAAKKVDDYLY